MADSANSTPVLTDHSVIVARLQEERQDVMKPITFDAIEAMLAAARKARVRQAT